MSFDGIPLSELCGIAAGTPPEGQVSNLVDPPTLASLIWGLTISMTVLSLFFTVTRIYVNFRKLRASDSESTQPFAKSCTCGCESPTACAERDVTNDRVCNHSLGPECGLLGINRCRYVFPPPPRPDNLQVLVARQHASHHKVLIHFPEVKWARHLWDIPVCWMTGDYMKVAPLSRHSLSLSHALQS